MGTVNVSEDPKPVGIKQLKDAIPPDCFDSSAVTSLSYLVRDIIYASILVYLAFQIHLIPNSTLRVVAWIAYGFAQGCVGTGLWIIGHECGHGAFSDHKTLNDVVGWAVHSSLLVPYFSWQITHARHHRYTGNIAKDVVFVPPTEDELHARQSLHSQLLEHAEDTPLVTLARLLQHQLIGWQVYLLCNATAGKKSLPEPDTIAKKSIKTNHFALFNNSLFSSSQRLPVLLSDIGLLLTFGFLYWVSTRVGIKTTLLLYLVPYLWVHHWLVAITFLHHTHPEVPYHTEETWTFSKGAMGTVDRSLGFIGRHFFHEIVDYHLIHHLFPKIPFYHAERATHAILPVIGTRYIEAKQESFLWSLYTTFKSCNYVAERKDGKKAGVGELYWVVKQK